MFMLLWAWATVSLSTHPECLKAPFTSIWSFGTFTSSEFAQLMLQQLRQVYTKSCNYKISNNLDYVQTSRCVHIHHVQTRHCVHIHHVQTRPTLNKSSNISIYMYGNKDDRYLYAGLIFSLPTQAWKNDAKKCIQLRHNLSSDKNSVNQHWKLFGV